MEISIYTSREPTTKYTIKVANQCKTKQKENQKPKKNGSAKKLTKITNQMQPTVKGKGIERKENRK